MHTSRRNLQLLTLLGTGFSLIAVAACESEFDETPGSVAEVLDQHDADSEMPIVSTVHDEHTPGAISSPGNPDDEVRERKAPRTRAEVAAIHESVLSRALKEAPVHIEFDMRGLNWEFEEDHTSPMGAWLVATVEPIASCNAPDVVRLRIPYSSELNLSTDTGETILVLGQQAEQPDTVDSVFVTRWNGETINSPKSAVPVPLPRSAVFAECDVAKR